MVAKAAVLDGTAMSWEEFVALGDGARAEYLDGRVVVAPSPNRLHQRASRLLSNLLEAGLPPDFEVTEGWSWKPGSDEFVPDIVVHPRTDELVRFTGTPVLCVEVLSGDRAADLVVKTTKYAAYGLDRYWVLDTERRELYVFARRASTYELEQTVGPEPTDVDFGVGGVRIDLAVLLPQSTGT